MTEFFAWVKEIHITDSRFIRVVAEGNSGGTGSATADAAPRIEYYHDTLRNSHAPAYNSRVRVTIAPG